MNNDEKRWLQVTFPRRMFYSLMWNMLSVLTGFSEDNLTSTSGWMFLICMAHASNSNNYRGKTTGERNVCSSIYMSVCWCCVTLFLSRCKKYLLSLDEKITEQINNISKVQLGESMSLLGWLTRYWWKIIYRNMAKSMTAISPKTNQRIGKDSWSQNPWVLCMICRWLEGLESLNF